MTFHFKLPNTEQLTASPEQALGEEKRKLPFLDMLSRDLKREASPFNFLHENFENRRGQRKGLQKS